MNARWAGWYLAFTPALHETDEGSFNLAAHDGAVHEKGLELLRLPWHADRQKVNRNPPTCRDDRLHRESLYGREDSTVDCTLVTPRVVGG